MKNNMVVYFGEPSTVTVASWEKPDFSDLPVFHTETGVTHAVFEADDIVLKYDLLDPKCGCKETRYPADVSRIVNVYR